MSASLVYVTADGRQKEIPLKRAVQLIGRQNDCHIRIPVASASRHHAELVVDGSRVSIRDLGSSNGSFVNCKRVTQQDLAPGDLVCIGEQVFVVRIDGKPGDIDAEDAYDDGLVKSPATSASKDGAAQAQGGGRPATLRPIAGGDSDDSSVADFDFLDDGDLDDKQPKL
jgi:pSer/pThr/pTyr-binding forkhead associated (FHA) protein